MWQNDNTGAGDVPQSAKTTIPSIPVRSRWDSTAQEDSSAKHVKRRWDQDTPEEPSRKKTDQIDVSPGANVNSSAWKNPGKILLKLDSGLQKDGVSPATSKSDSKPATQKMGFSIGMKSNKPKPVPIKMSLGLQKPKDTPSTLPKTKISAAAANAFNEDEESDEEEMPPEARMRMKNIGRETPTAAGPNSFGKSKMGFCDRQKMIQKELEQIASSDKIVLSKLE